MIDCCIEVGRVVADKKAKCLTSVYVPRESKWTGPQCQVGVNAAATALLQFGLLECVFLAACGRRMEWAGSPSSRVVVKS